MVLPTATMYEFQSLLFLTALGVKLGLRRAALAERTFDTCDFYSYIADTL